MNTRGNNAYEYDYDTGSEAFFVPENKVEEKKIILSEIKLKAQDSKIKKRIIAGITLLVALGVTVAIRYASVTQINYENHNLEQKHKELLAAAENLEVENESSMSIAEIAEKAEKELGMHKPLSYQIKYINVDSIDQTEHADTEIATNENEDKPFYKRFADSFKLFFGLI